MTPIEVTDRLWQWLLAKRNGGVADNGGDWTVAEQAARDLYGPLVQRSDQPYAIGQIGQSLDGRIATESGDARDVSGPDGLIHLHRLRALVDGVVIGVRTAIHDEPRLTVRLCDGPHPTRIVIDPRGRLSNDAPLFRDDGVRRLVIQSVDTKRPAGVEVIHLPSSEGTVDPAAILKSLREQGVGNLLIEGGGFTISRFIQANLLNRLHVSVAPIVIGGGPAGLTMPTVPEKLVDAIRPETRFFSLGSDVVFDCSLR